MAKPAQDADTQQTANPPTVDPAVEAASEGRPSARDYQSSGQTVVRTRKGHAVVPSDTSLPVVDEHGVKMSKENAEKVVSEYPDYALIDTEKKED